MCELLQHDEFTLIAAAKGFQALAPPETRPVRPVLCELELPGLSGTAVRAREAAGRRKPTPFVLVADTGTPELPAADGYLPKPFAANQLLALGHSRPAVARAAA